MPVRVIDRVASPRTASADPAAVGETAVTSGIAAISARTLGHWSIEISLCAGRWMVAASISPRRRGRATSSGAVSWICGWDVRTRLMKLACRPDSMADMKTITATPMAMPMAMKIVCMRPSRRKRRPTMTSNGSQRFMARQPAPSIRRRSRPSPGRSCHRQPRRRGFPPFQPPAVRFSPGLSLHGRRRS